MEVADIFWIDNASFEFLRENDCIAFMRYRKPCEYEESCISVSYHSRNLSIPRRTNTLFYANVPQNFIGITANVCGQRTTLPPSHLKMTKVR